MTKVDPTSSPLRGPVASSSSGGWTYLSNHAHVLLCLARDPEIRVRDVARLVGITERGVARILLDLEESGVIEKHKSGRRNSYSANLDLPLRHALESQRTIGDLMRLFTSSRQRRNQVR